VRPDGGGLGQVGQVQIALEGHAFDEGQAAELAWILRPAASGQFHSQPHGQQQTSQRHHHEWSPPALLY